MKVLKILEKIGDAARSLFFTAACAITIYMVIDFLTDGRIGNERVIERYIYVVNDTDEMDETDETDDEMAENDDNTNSGREFATLTTKTI